MDVALAVEVLFLDPECALHAAVFVHPVPERPVMGLKLVAGPGPPALKFALGFDVQIRMAIIECVFGKLVSRKMAFLWGVSPLKSDPPPISKPA